MDNFWDKKKILITGGSGFVGSQAVEFLLKLGADLTVLISPKTTTQEIQKKLGNVKNQIKLIQADLLRPEQADVNCRNIDIIMNFAAIDGGLEFKLKHSAEIFSQNMRMSLNMLEAAVKADVKTFLLVSSADIYSSSQNQPLTEASPVEIQHNQNIDGYKLAKWTIELAAKEFARQYGINIVIIRPSNLYGPKDNFEDKSRIRIIPSAIRKIFLDHEPITLWGSGNQVKSFLYIDDFLRICCKLIENEVFNIPVNVASKNTITIKQLVEKIIELSNIQTELIIDSLKPEGSSSKEFNLSLLDSKIGQIQETSLDQGLKNTISYFNESISKP